MPAQLTARRQAFRGHWAWAALVALAVVAAPNFDRLQAAYMQRWGAGAALQRFQAWHQMLQQDNTSTAEADRLKRVNDFFNRQIVFTEDQATWGQADYWATPLETLGRGAGDCEDFAIAKYFSLRALGLDAVRLRLIYVRARTGSGEATPTQAHMVLAYYAKPDAEPLVLDNLIADIRPASRRPDLTPVFSFNSQGVFAAGAVADQAAPLSRLSRWEDLLQRSRAEGFE